MGSSAEANLAYGYDLGDDEDFKCAERGEYDGPEVPWLDDDDDDFVEAAGKRLLESVGFTETDRRADGYYDRKRAAEAALGVEATRSGADGFHGWILIAAGSKRSVEWAETMTLDPGQMLVEPGTKGWDGKLAAALTALGLTPTQNGPRWLVFPFYG